MTKEEHIAQITSEYPDMSPWLRAAMLESVEEYYDPGYPCLPFDPTKLVALALEQRPDRPDFAEALGRCTQQWPESALYTHLRDPALRGTPVAYAGGFRLLCPELGDLVIDMLADGSVDGIEYFDRVMSLQRP